MSPKRAVAQWALQAALVGRPLGLFRFDVMHFTRGVAIAFACYVTCSQPLAFGTTQSPLAIVDTFCPTCLWWILWSAFNVPRPLRLAFLHIQLAHLATGSHRPGLGLNIFSLEVGA